KQKSVITPRPQVTFSLPIKLSCEYSSHVLSIDAPFAREEASALTQPASRTAPSTLSRPAPCSRLLKFLIGWALYIRIALTKPGVRLGLASNIIAAAPATTGVAIEVPLIYMTWSVVVVVPLIFEVGYSVIKLVSLPTLLGEIAPISLFPGATTSGFIKLS